MKNIWKQLPKPFFALAPMHGATNTVFRQRVAAMGKPDIMFTEFVSSDGLCSKGYPVVAKALEFTQKERPLIAQIWGNKPEYMKVAASKVAELGFDGVDINMSCPVRAVLKKGAGAALSDNPNLALEIIDAVKEGVAGQIPVSVKIRLGVTQVQIDTWAETILSTSIQALTVHTRTAADMSKVPARWNYLTQVVATKKKLGVDTLIIGNGDITSRDQGIALAKDYGLDGVMIGRRVFANPWVFSQVQGNKSKLHKLLALQAHLDLFKAYYGTGKVFGQIKRFVKVYLKGFVGAKALEQRLVTSVSANDFESILNQEIAQEQSVLE